MCVDKVWRRAEEEKAEEEPGIQNQKQEPHTKMWGKDERRVDPCRSSSPVRESGPLTMHDSGETVEISILASPMPSPAVLLMPIRLIAAQIPLRMKILHI